MVPRNKTSVLVFFVLFIYLSSGQFKCFSSGASSIYSLHEGGSIMVNYSRKLMSHNVVDYDDAGANPKHDLRGRRGGGGKNPRLCYNPN